MLEFYALHRCICLWPQRSFFVTQLCYSSEFPLLCPSTVCDTNICYRCYRCLSGIKNDSPSSIPPLTYFDGVIFWRQYDHTSFIPRTVRRIVLHGGTLAELMECPCCRGLLVLLLHVRALYVQGLVDNFRWGILRDVNENGSILEQGVARGVHCKPWYCNINAGYCSTHYGEFERWRNVGYVSIESLLQLNASWRQSCIKALNFGI